MHQSRGLVHGRDGQSSDAIVTRSIPNRVRPIAGGQSSDAGIRTLIESVADTDATVLIRGESGVGKDPRGSQHSRRLQPREWALRQGQLRRHPAGPARVRILRTRERSLHGGAPPQTGTIRVREHRFVLSRRGRGTTAVAPGEAPARPAGFPFLARRRSRRDRRRHAYHRGDES